MSKSCRHLYEAMVCQEAMAPHVCGGHHDDDDGGYTTL
jgi:hypothetical protein